MTKILTVTAEDEFAAACATALPEHDAIQVVSAASVEEAINILERQTDIECIVSDHDLPNTNGIAFLEAVRARNPTLPFILFTTEGSEMVASRAISAGVTDYLIKERHKNQWEQLATLIRNAVRYYRDRSGIVNTEERAKTLLNAANDIIAVVRDGTVAYLNETGISYIRYDTKDQTSPVSVSDVLVADGTTPLDELLAAVQSGRKTLDHRDGELITAEGTCIPVEITATRVTWTETPAVVLILRDVSEQEDQANELRLKNQVIDEAPIGITIADATQSNTPLIYANDKFHEVTGYEEDDTLGQDFQFLQGENTNPSQIAEIRDVADTEESATVELRNYRTDGTEFWNRVTVAPITNDTGDVTHFVGFQEDVTERVEYEQMLRRFQRAVEAAGHGIYITDPDGVITYANPAFERITGYDSNEIVGENPRVLKSGEMSDTYYNRLWATISRGHVWEEEIHDQKKSGELYYAHQTIAPLTRSNGDVEAYVAIQQDITARKKDEFQLRQYERAIEGADELIAAIDHERHYLFANEAYRDFHGLDSELLAEMTLADAIGTETYETVEPNLERAFDGEVVQYRMTRTRPHRSDRVFDIRYYPLTDDTGHVEGVVATMRDLTEQVEREQHLTSLDRMLRHNIQNELNLILGHAEMIDDQASDKIAELSATIEESADRILEQANKEREIVELLSDPADPTHLNLADVVGTVVDQVRGEHPDAKISVEVPTDLQILSIPEVQRAIEELVKNAVIHSDDRPPQVRITVTKHEATVEIQVADDGPGIPPNERRVITGDSEIDDVTHSSGMGLWLVKRIVSRIDGDIQFEELADSGSVVTLLLPFYDT
ncbi:PAS domain S-box protein [Halorubrum sp. BV1]|uniref:PAS domain S-box protein n=1 Tax=Halorubrum sp. BV1 TaxID=1498500 RepID=UPI0006787136|nr:PAS domain S-box protein [Halorubrum sp. BV1]